MGTFIAAHATAIAIGSAAAGTGLAIRSSEIATRQRQYELRRQAEQEKLAAKDREVERRRALVASLANQNAMLGAMGITAVGSPQALAARDARLGGLDISASRASLAARMDTLDRTGQAARSAGTSQNALSLLNFAERTAMRGKI